MSVQAAFPCSERADGRPARPSARQAQQQMRGHVHAGPDEGARRDEREGFSRKGREGRQTSEKARDDEKPYGGRQLGIRARPGECGADQNLKVVQNGHATQVKMTC